MKGNPKVNSKEITVLQTSMVVIILAASVAAGNVSLDKTGTNVQGLKNEGSQVASRVQLASLGSLQAERGGFEPPVGLPRLRFSRPVLV
jgi:hypothetical protein